MAISTKTLDVRKDQR